jgi:hypothetical protein
VIENQFKHNLYLAFLTLDLWDDVMSKYHCDCGGEMIEYSANVKVCQKCKKIPKLDTLLDLLREMGAREETIKSLEQDLHFVPV